MTQPQLAPLTPELIEEFCKIVGPQGALQNADDIAPYLREWRDKYIGQSKLVLKPSCCDEVSQILRHAHKHKIGVVPQGGNTGLVGGQIPLGQDELILSTERMNKIRHIDADNFSLCAEAGTILQTIQDVADHHDRLFPLSLASQGSCQIGGNIATNAGGVGVLAYGNTRNLVLGLEAVLPNGDIWHGLRELRKDNTGYNLKDLFIGSEGTLGVITAAVLKLFPKPKQKITAFIGLNQLKDVSRFFSFIMENIGQAVTAFELIPERGIEYVLTHGAQKRPLLQKNYPWQVLLETSFFQESTTLRADYENLLTAALEKNLISDCILASSERQAQDIWYFRDMLSEVQKYEGGSIKHDVSVPIKSILPFITRANERVEQIVPQCRPVPFGHFGDGNIHYNISQPVEVDKQAFLDKWDEVSAAVHEIVMEFGGSISAEHGIGQMKRDAMRTIKSPVELAAMKHIKRSLDPHGILNPGKLLP